MATWLSVTAAAESTPFMNVNVVSMGVLGVDGKGGWLWGGGRVERGGGDVAHVQRRERAEAEEGEGAGG